MLRCQTVIANQERITAELNNLRVREHQIFHHAFAIAQIRQVRILTSTLSARCRAALIHFNQLGSNHHAAEVIKAFLTSESVLVKAHGHPRLTKNFILCCCFCCMRLFAQTILRGVILLKLKLLALIFQ